MQLVHNNERRDMLVKIASSTGFTITKEDTINTIGELRSNKVCKLYNTDDKAMVTF